MPWYPAGLRFAGFSGNLPMGTVFKNCADAAERYGVAGDYLAGANIYAFEKVTDAIWTQGYI